MKRIFYTFLIFFVCANIHSQDKDSTKLLQEVSALLDNHKKTVQEILTDTTFNPIHPLTSFRVLIKKNAHSNSLSYVSDNEPGKRIVVKAQVKNQSGIPIPNAQVYCYQTDNRGWYSANAPHVNGNEGDRRHARLFGYLVANKEGEFTLQTIHPVGYPNSELPAHIHIEVTAPGYAVAITEFLFDDDPRLNANARTQSINEGFIISKEVEGAYHYIVLLRNQ